MGYTVRLLAEVRHRYVTHAAISNADASQTRADVKTLLDTGAFNSMIDLDLAKGFCVMLPLSVPISIGGNLGAARGCVIPTLTVGDFEMARVFALAFPFRDWLVRHIILGANVLNNWDFTASRTDNVITFAERVPPDAPNKTYPYQNYFTRGAYAAIQEETV